MARSIIDQIMLHPEKIRCTDKFELVLYDRVFPNSNMLNLLEFLMYVGSVDKSTDIPIGGKEIYKFLLNDLKIPPGWIKVFIPNQPIITQEVQDLSWRLLFCCAIAQIGN